SALTCEGVTAHGVESFRPTSARLRERGAMRNADLSRKQQGGASRHSGKLEELFVEELTRLQPKPGFMRLVKDRVMHAWRELKTDAAQRIAEFERKQKAIREKLDRLDAAFLYERTIDIDTYDRHRDKLRGELTLAQMARRVPRAPRSVDVEDILAFAE